MSGYGTAALMERQRIQKTTRPLGRAGALFTFLDALSTTAAASQDTTPPDTDTDAGVEALVTRSCSARHRTAEGIESYEGTLHQRMFVGLTALSFRRERGLLEHERIANIRWSADRSRVSQWIGMRSAIPIAGLDTGKSGEYPAVRIGYSGSAGCISAGTGPDEELAEDMATDLLIEAGPIGAPAASWLRDWLPRAWASSPIWGGLANVKRVSSMTPSPPSG